MREDMVAVKAKDGGHLVHCASGYALKLKAGETATKWEDGSPITRVEFENVLEPTGMFEIATPARAESKQKEAPAVKIAEKNTEA